MGSDHQQPQLYNNTHLFTQAVTTPAMISVHSLTPEPTIDPASTTTIKMEDLTAPNFSTPSRAPPTSHPSHPSPPGSENARSVKKRKSWGQELPEPKTNLPPRKRAKTEDEKEQRRIERVKRNRLAAHNSRERKRQEVELLQAEKDKLEDQLRISRDVISQMARQLEALKQRHPGEVIESFENYTAFETPSPYPQYAREASETVCPRQTHSFPSPVSMDSMDSPRDESCQPETPTYAESVGTELDQTRYPAAIPCDLLCQSSSRTTNPSSPSIQATLAILIYFHLTLPLMRNLWTNFSTSTTSPFASTLLTWWTRLTASVPTSPSLNSQIPTAWLMHLMMQTPSNCRIPCAPSTATGISQLRTSVGWVARSSETRDWASRDSAVCGRLRSQRQWRRRTGRRIGVLC